MFGRSVGYGRQRPPLSVYRLSLSRFLFVRWLVGSVGSFGRLVGQLVSQLQDSTQLAPDRFSTLTAYSFCSVVCWPAAHPVRGRILTLIDRPTIHDTPTTCGAQRADCLVNERYAIADDNGDTVVQLCVVCAPAALSPASHRPPPSLSPTLQLSSGWSGSGV